MTLVRWTPRETGTTLLNRFGGEFGWMDRFFEDFARPLFRATGDGQPLAWAPRVDVRETEAEYVVHADVPGLRREDLEIELAADRVTLKGHHQEEREETEGCAVCREREYGDFERVIALPEEVRADDARASLKDGVLTLNLPKAHTTEVRRIEVTEH